MIQNNPRKHPLYQIWKGMRARCTYEHHASYSRYGGRGIAICPEWGDFMVFYEWSLANGYQTTGVSLDRINNDGNYSPDNCRWATYKVQANNTSRNLMIAAFGETKTPAEWADDIRCTVPLNTLYQRLENAWSPEEAIIVPSKRKSTQRPITFDYYQAIAETTAIYPNKGDLGGLAYASLGLSSETGELCGKIKKIIRDDDGIISDKKRQEVISELSDILWYCAAIASELNMSLGEIAENNLQKLEDRANRNVIGGSGDNR